MVIAELTLDSADAIAELYSKHPLFLANLLAKVMSNPSFKSLPDDDKVRMWRDVIDVPYLNMSSPISTTEVPSVDIQEYLLKLFTEDKLTGFRDSVYWVASDADLEKLLHLSPVRLLSYNKDKLDCDNYADELVVYLTRFGITSVGRAVGMTPFGYHEWVVAVAMVDGFLTVFYIEPQDSTMWRVESKDDPIRNYGLDYISEF